MQNPKDLFPLFEELENKEKNIAVVGLGYVGLPLAVALAKNFSVLGFDINEKRIEELKKGQDSTGEVDEEKLKNTEIKFTSDPKIFKDCPLIIIAVPTPIDAHRNPDLGAVKGASASVAKHFSKGSIVVYESTVYPGVTEEICVPVLEEFSGFKYGEDFGVGYSPERINPGDKVHTVDKIVKIVAASSDLLCDLLAKVYGKVTSAGIHKASSIKVAEAAKVIENTQRDLNIALMNELAIIFDRLGIDTREVLEAASTKWNFLNFTPGLVGGHCIGVDPYYLTYKAEEVNYHPDMILAGRRINDGMAKYVAEKAVKMLIAAKSQVSGARVGILGLSFKENVPDLRNTKVVDIRLELKEYGVEVLVHDPLASSDEAYAEYGFHLCDLEEFKDLDGLIMAVNHKDYADLDLEKVQGFFQDPGKVILLDIKGKWPLEELEKSGFNFWRL